MCESSKTYSITVLWVFGATCDTGLKSKKEGKMCFIVGYMRKCDSIDHVKVELNATIALVINDGL